MFILLNSPLFSFGLGLFVLNISNHGNAELIQLAAKLPHVLFSDKIRYTIKRYFSALKTWGNWARSNFVIVLPSPKYHFAQFLVYLIGCVNSLSAYDAVVHGVSWALPNLVWSHPLFPPLLNR